MKTLCRLCGVRHNLWEDHVWREVSNKVVQGVSNSAPVSNKPAQDVSNNGTDRLKLWRVSNRERYNAYMREYMRRRRAVGGV